MRKFTNLFILIISILISGIVISSCEDDAVPEAKPFTSVTVKEGASLTAFRGTTKTFTISLNSNETLGLKVNGADVTINANSDVTQDVTYEFDVPEGDPVGTVYDFDIAVTSASGTKESTVSIKLIPGPGLTEPDLDPLVTLLPGFTNIEMTTLLSTTDVLDTYTTKGGFQLAGSADGMGMVKNVDGNFELMVNCEDHYSVARITLNKDLKPLKGDYMLNSSVADFARQCSATMWEKAIHGGSQDLFLSSSESFNYTTRGIDPFIPVPDPDANYNLPALGQFEWENNVPLPKDAYPGKTVIFGGDDDSSDSQGQFILYYSANGDQDLTGGKIYVLRLDGATSISTEEDLDFNEEYDVEFVEVTGSTQAEFETASKNVFSLQFMRVEDIDYGKGSAAKNRVVYFAVTGRGPSTGTYNDWGTVYKLELDESSPMSGKLTQIISGNTDTNKMDGNLAALQSPDNICVTENFIYLQEDPNSFSRNHAAYIYQSNLDGGNIKTVLELKQVTELGAPVSGFSGEFGALIDISDKVGEDDVFLLAVQPHYWTEDEFSALDGHDLGIPPGFPGEDNQGSQIVILRGLPR